MHRRRRRDRLRRVLTLGNFSCHEGWCGECFCFIFLFAFFCVAQRPEASRIFHPGVTQFNPQLGLFLVKNRKYPRPHWQVLWHPIVELLSLALCTIDEELPP